MIIDNIAVFKDKSTGVWVVRDNSTNKELAHESNKRDALNVAKVYAKHSEKKQG